MRNPFKSASAAKSEKTENDDQNAEGVQSPLANSSLKIEIFKAGKRTSLDGTSIDITIADLEGVASNYDVTKHEAPIVIGHPKTDTPAYGWVKSLTVEGESLFAEIAEISPEFQEWVKKGHYKKISCSFWMPDASGNPTQGFLALKHVGFLGGAVPAVKGMRQASFAEKDAGIVSFDETDKPEQQNPNPNRNKEHEHTVNSLNAKIRHMEALAFAEKAINDGRMLPLFKSEVVSFMETISQAGEISFAEGDGKEPIDAVSWFKNYVERQPVIINFGAFDMSDSVVDGKERQSPISVPDGYHVPHDALEEAHRVAEIAKREKISFSDAAKR